MSKMAKSRLTVDTGCCLVIELDSQPEHLQYVLPNRVEAEQSDFFLMAGFLQSEQTGGTGWKPRLLWPIRHVALLLI